MHIYIDMNINVYGGAGSRRCWKQSQRCALRRRRRRQPRTAMASKAPTPARRALRYRTTPSPKSPPLEVTQGQI